MPKLTRWQKTALTLIIVGAAAWVFLRSVPAAAPNLLARAVKITALQDLAAFDWFSSHEILVRTSTNVVTLPSGGVKYTYPWSGYFDLIDVRTQKRTRMSGLSAVINRHAKQFVFAPSNFQRSPDGQWLLWERMDAADGGMYPVTARIDGTGYHEWKMWSDARHHWADGHRWLSNVNREHARYIIVHDAANPSADYRRFYNNVPAQNTAFLNAINDQYRGKAQTTLLWAEPEKNNTSNVSFSIKVKPAGAAPDTMPTTVDTISFAAGSQIADNIPNPQRDRIEFLVRDPDVPAYSSILHHLIPFYSIKSHPVERLYIYRLDTKRLCEVGHVDDTSGANMDLINVFWLDDGRHIQFIYKDALYIVPID